MYCLCCYIAKIGKALCIFDTLVLAIILLSTLIENVSYVIKTTRVICLYIHCIRINLETTVKVCPKLSGLLEHNQNNKLCAYADFNTVTFDSRYFLFNIKELAEELIYILDYNDERL